MNNIIFIIYKEWLELRRSKQLMLQVIIQSLVYGAVFPAVTWLMMSEILPVKIEELKIENLDLQWGKYLTVYYPMLLPFFMAQITSAFTLPAVSYEIENQTLEHMLVLPISWFHILAGKWIYYVMCSLIISYLIGLIYWMGTFLILENNVVIYLTAYFMLLIPSICIYVVSIAIMISALTKETKVSNIYSSILTWGLFLVLFFLAWMTELELSNLFIVILSLSLLLISVVCLCVLYKINTEKLIV